MRHAGVDAEYVNIEIHATESCGADASLLTCVHQGANTSVHDLGIVHSQSITS